MSLRFDNAADYLQRTTDIPSPAAFTMMAWVFPAAAPAEGYAGPFLRLAEDPFARTISVGFDYIQTLTLWANDDFYTGSSIDLSVWYHVAIVGDEDNLYVYLNGVLDITTVRGVMTPTRLQVGSNSEWSEFLNGRVSAVKIYDLTFSADDIITEMGCHELVRTDDVNSWLPMVGDTVADSVLDYSGLGRDFTANGTLGIEDGPPIPYRLAIARLSFDLLSVQAQFARPDGDVSAGSWTATPLWSKLDEAPADDGDFITSATAPSNDTCEISLSELTDPLSSVSHILRVRRKKNAASSNQIDMRYRLLQGTTEIASWTDDTNISDVFFEMVEHTLTGGQADAITDYADLRVEIRANQVAVTPPAPTFNAAGAIAASATSGASITPALPAGFAANDIHIIVAHHSGSVDFNTPSGWTKITALSGTNTAAQIVAVFWRRAQGGDVAPAITMASSVATVRIARCYGFRGCITSGDPWDSGSGAGPTKSNNAASATVATTSITTTINNCLVLFFDLYEDDPTARSTPSGYTATGTVGTSSLGTDASENCFRKALSGTGTENPSTTVSGGTFANSVNVGILIALKPPLASDVSAQVSWVEFEAPGVEGPAPFMAKGQTLIDFGSFPGKSDATVTVTGQTNIAADSQVEAWIRLEASSDHTADEHLVDPPLISAGNIIPGTGFTIYATARDGVSVPDAILRTSAERGFDTVIPNQEHGRVAPRVYGQWTVSWAWA